MKTLVTSRFRLYSTRTQEWLVEGTLETCRRLNNSLLADRMVSSTGFNEQKRSLVTLKSSNKFLKALNSQVLQDVAFRLDWNGPVWGPASTCATKEEKQVRSCEAGSLRTNGWRAGNPTSFMGGMKASSGPFISNQAGLVI